MSNIVSPSRSRQFTIRSVLGDAVKMLSAHPKLFFGLALVAWLPGAIFTFLLPFHCGRPGPFSEILIPPVHFIMTLLIQGAASIAVFSVLQGRAIDIRASLSACMNRFAPLFALSLIVGLINLPVSFMRILNKLVTGRFGYGQLLYAFKTNSVFQALWNIADAHALSFPLMLLSSFIMCILYLAVPVCVMERRTPFESLKRGAALTLGYRVRIFGLIVILNIIFYWFLILVSNQTEFLILALIPPGALLLWFLFLSNLAAVIVTVIPQTFFCLIPPVVYYRLKELKEGVTPAQTAGANTAP